MIILRRRDSPEVTAEKGIETEGALMFTRLGAAEWAYDHIGDRVKWAYLYERDGKYYVSWGVS